MNKSIDSKYKRKKGIVGYIFILILMLVAFSIQVTYTLWVSSLGGNFSDYQKENYKLSEEILNKKLKLSQTTSLSYFDNRASELGYIKPNSVLYVKPDEEVAKAY